VSELNSLLKSASSAIESAKDLPSLDQLRVAYLGKKGEVTALLKNLGQLPGDQRRAAGQEINKVKQAIQQLLEQRKLILD
jgi:phenylalanyl-tRNA synthetase alpha chain